jgi:hypothetical protein
MSLEELLRSSLEGVNREFLEADKALHGEVAAAGDALSKISGGALKVKLERLAEGEDGVVYGFLLEAKQGSGTSVWRLSSEYQGLSDLVR